MAARRAGLLTLCADGLRETRCVGAYVVMPAAYIEPLHMNEGLLGIYFGHTSDIYINLFIHLAVNQSINLAI